MIWLKRIAYFFIVAIIIVTVTTVIFWMPAAQEPAYQLEKTWGVKGQAEGEFNEPTGVAVSKNEVFVSDSRNKRIQVFDLEGNFKRLIGVKGAGLLNRPMNLTIANEELYVADFFNDQILVFGLDGSFKRTIGQSGKGVSEFNAPGGIAVNSKGELFITIIYIFYQT